MNEGRSTEFRCRTTEVLDKKDRFDASFNKGLLSGYSLREAFSKRSVQGVPIRLLKASQHRRL